VLTWCVSLCCCFVAGFNTIRLPFTFDGLRVSRHCSMLVHCLQSMECALREHRRNGQQQLISWQDFCNLRSLAIVAYTVQRSLMSLNRA
jgi:hypothetical protein